MIRSILSCCFTVSLLNLNATEQVVHFWFKIEYDPSFYGFYAFIVVNMVMALLLYVFFAWGIISLIRWNITFSIGRASFPSSTHRPTSLFFPFFQVSWNIYGNIILEICVVVVAAIGGNMGDILEKNARALNQISANLAAFQVKCFCCNMYDFTSIWLFD